MKLDIDLHWQELDHLQKGAKQRGQSVEAYLEGLVHDAILWEAVAWSQKSEAKPFTPEDIAELRRVIAEKSARQPA